MSSIMVHRRFSVVVCIYNSASCLRSKMPKHGIEPWTSSCRREVRVMRSTTELFRLMGKVEAEISIMCWVCSTLHLDASPGLGKHISDDDYDACHMLGIPELGQCKMCLERWPLARSRLLGTDAFRGRSGPGASMLHTLVSQRWFANYMPGAMKGMNWQSNLGLMCQPGCPVGRVLCRRQYTRDARPRCMKEAQQSIRIPGIRRARHDSALLHLTRYC